MDSNKPTVAEKEVRREPWQYSLRGLLLLMTLVSVLLAIGVHFAGFLFALLILGLLQAAMLLGADWLIRPGNRRALAFVTASSWTAAGCGLILLGASAVFTTESETLYGLLVSRNVFLSTVLAAGIAATGVVCYVIAIRRWRQLTSAPAQR